MPVAFLRALQAQFALVLTLVQIIEAEEGKEETKRAVGVGIEELELVHGEPHVWIGLEVGGGFQGFGFGDIQLAGAQRGIGGFEARFDLIPGEGSLGEGRPHGTGYNQGPSDVRDMETGSHQTFLIASNLQDVAVARDEGVQHGRKKNREQQA